MEILTVVAIIGVVFVVIGVGFLWIVSSRLEELWTGIDYLARMESDRQKEKYRRPWEREEGE